MKLINICRSETVTLDKIKQSVKKKILIMKMKIKIHH
jgi:hypothetical protein